MTSVLLIDADLEHARAVVQHLRPQGFTVETAPSGRQGRQKLADAAFDMTLVDFALPDVSGLSLLGYALRDARSRQVIVTSGSGLVTHAVDAMRAGAADFIAKPVTPPELLKSISRALGAPPLPGDDERWRRQFAPGLVGHDPATLRLLAMVRRVAQADCDVMITGPSGTGKELVARCLHRASARQTKPFVPINCAAIPRDLIESEMFGHARGAFTGATERRVGKFEAASGGTLFLDEAGEMDLALQGKILRAIQEREVTPVGDTRTIHVDTRIVSATNQNLDQLCAEKTFREDLFYRLNVVPIEVPALAERRGDIPELVEHFLERTARRYQRAGHRLGAAARQALCSYGWPGNIRELQNTIERIVVLKSGTGPITPDDLPQHMCAQPPKAAMNEMSLPQDGFNIDQFLTALETRLTYEALSRANNNRRQAAKLLGLNRTTLVERLKKLNLVEEPSKLSGLAEPG